MKKESSGGMGRDPGVSGTRSRTFGLRTIGSDPCRISCVAVQNSAMAPKPRHSTRFELCPFSPFISNEENGHKQARCRSLLLFRGRKHEVDL